MGAMFAKPPKPPKTNDPRLDEQRLKVRQAGALAGTNDLSGTLLASKSGGGAAADIGAKSLLGI